MRNHSEPIDFSSTSPDLVVCVKIEKLRSHTSDCQKFTRFFLRFALCSSFSSDATNNSSQGRTNSFEVLQMSVRFSRARSISLAQWCRLSRDFRHANAPANANSQATLTTESCLPCSSSSLSLSSLAGAKFSDFTCRDLCRAHQV